LSWQPEKEWAKHVWWLFTVIMDESIPLTRFEVLEGLKSRAVEGRQIVYPITQLPPYHDDRLAFPVADRIVDRGVHLPTWSGLSREQVKRVCDSLVASLNPALTDREEAAV
jgi:perosamine synthetase